MMQPTVVSKMVEDRTEQSRAYTPPQDRVPCNSVVSKPSLSAAKCFMDIRNRVVNFLNVCCECMPISTVPSCRLLQGHLLIERGSGNSGNGKWEWK